MESNRDNPSKKFEGYKIILEKFDMETRYRTLPCDKSDSNHIDLTSNDYLGIAKRFKDIQKDFFNIYPDASFSSSASRLLSRRQKDHESLEAVLAALYDMDVLIFNSGYHANVGIIQALNIEGTVFLCDKLSHASMIDGLTLAGADYRRWRHNDIDTLRKLLTKYKDLPRCIVIVESIYSMDGDIAPLWELAQLKKSFPNIILYVDEAHGFGVRGNRGLGVCEELGIIKEIDILVGTFGKAAASAGAFVATNPIIKDYLVNCARSLIFSTALPPLNMAWTQYILTKIISMSSEREHLNKISRLFKQGIEDITGEKNSSQSQIIPLIVGDAYKAQLLSTRLSMKSIDALPIRRPTVPPGSERIRFSLSADLTESQIHRILNIIKSEFNDI